MRVRAVNGYAYSNADYLGDYIFGSTVTLVATPKVKEANFLGWFDESGNLISDKEVFEYTVTRKVILTASYDNTPAKAETLGGIALKNAMIEKGENEVLFENSIIHRGNSSLVKSVYSRILAGEDISVAGIGGSITQGALSYKGQSYGEVIVKKLNELGCGTVTYHNAGIGATTSVYGVARMQDDMLKHNPDLVIVDFTTNDQHTDDYAFSYEALIRTLAEKGIATIAVLYGHLVQDKPNEYLRDENCINLHLPTLIYYDIPTIDFYGTMWDHYLDANGDGKNESNDLIHWPELWSDFVHPNNDGHRLAAGTIFHYITKVATRLEQSTVTVPEKLFFPQSQYYLNSVRYQSDDDRFKFSGEGYRSVTVETDDPNGGNASALWKPWVIDKNGYIEFTVKKCKSLSWIRANSTTVRSAEIYINGNLYKKDATAHSGYTDNEPLPWTSELFYFDGSEDITVRIKCTSEIPYIIYNLQFAVGE